MRGSSRHETSQMEASCVDINQAQVPGGTVEQRSRRGGDSYPGEAQRGDSVVRDAAKQQYLPEARVSKP